MGEETLQRARDRLRSVLRSGDDMDCPCCGQRCKIYKRSINKTQAATLMWMLSETDNANDGWINFPEQAPPWIMRSKQHSTLKHWALIEQRSYESGDKKHSGDWRLTETGKKFIARQTNVPKYVYIYDDNLLKTSREGISIDDALTERFSYAELMQGNFKELE